MTPISKDFEFGKVLGTGGFAVVKMEKHVRTLDKFYESEGRMNIAQARSTGGHDVGRDRGRDPTHDVSIASLRW